LGEIGRRAGLPCSRFLADFLVEPEMEIILKKITVVRIVAAAIFLAASASAQTLPRQVLLGHVPAVVSRLKPVGRVAATERLPLAIGLPLRNQAGLDVLLQQLYDPHGTNYHKFLTLLEFTARFGPTEQDYQAVQDFARSNGFAVTGTHGNRLVLDIEANTADIERAFQITLRTFKHPTEPRLFFAPDTEPSVPLNLPVADMWGLSDYARPAPLARQVDPSKIKPLNSNGSGPGGAYRGGDFRNAYVPGASLTGSGQIAAVAEFDGYYQNDITNYEGQSGYTNVPLQNVLLDSVSGMPGYSGAQNAVVEVSLDIELIVAMAPGLSKVIVYEGSNPYDVFNRIATDNSAKQISCSWFWNHGPTHKWFNGISGTTLDSQLMQMAAQGQSFFQASGDSDAYTGSQAFGSAGPTPMDSVYVTSVGGTSLTMNGSGASWSSETVWNWGGNAGSGGGISSNYFIPAWQANVSMAANSGSTTRRNLPDVAMTADAVDVIHDNGSSGAFGGTSCAAPLWAGFCALANQQAIAAGGTNVGFLNPALYAIAAGTNYNSCFHDITTGNNIGNNTPGLFYATNGYDLATGLGTPNGTNLINFLAPLPCFLILPAGQNVTNGASLAFNATAGGRPPFSYRWLLNGTNLPAGGNVSGTASNVLAITSATTNNSGNYQIIATNNFGSVTSSVVVLSVGFAPALSAPPANLTILSGSNASFSATAGGSVPLVYQWRKNGTNLANGAGISGATSNVLTLSAVTTNSSGSYNVFVTNNFGASAGSVAVLTVVLPPTIAALTNQTIECGSNTTFVANASGTPPLNFQWSLDGSPLFGATNTIFSLTNVHSPGHTIVLAVTNLYGNETSSAALTIQDTTPPIITQCAAAQTLFAGTNCTAILPDYTGGLSATDACSGIVHFTQLPPAGSALPLGTNFVTFFVDDGNGNTNYCTAPVTVQEALPQIWWQTSSQTNHAGTGASFSVNVTACSPVSCQWYFNGLPDGGQTNNIFAFAPVSSCNAGNYQVVATSGAGSVTSSVAVLVVINDPTNISPAGAFQVGTQTECSGIVFNPGSSYIWEISDAATNWDWLNISGALNVEANSTNPFTIKIISLTASNTPGLAANFSGASNYHWIIATATGGLTNFNPNSFAVDASAFGNAFGGNFGVVQQGTNLVLQYVAPPAPLALSAGTVLGDGTFQLSFNGPVSQTYRILAATNLFTPLSNWSVLTTGNFNGGVILFTDVTATNLPFQFYRAVSP
jgi:subtilase family serine protease